MSLGRVAPILSFLLFGSVTSPLEGQGRQVRRGRQRIPWSEWAFTGTPVPQNPKVHVGLGGPLGGLWCEVLPCSRWDQAQARGPCAVHRVLTAGEFPEVPLKVPPTPPFPACLASPNSLGLPAFSRSTQTLASIASAGSSQAFLDTGGSLQCLHIDSSHSLPPLPTSLPNSSVPSGRPFWTAVPVHHAPRPLSCRALKSTARDVMGPSVSNGSSRHLGLLQVEPDARIPPAHPPPRVPWRDPGEGRVGPLILGRRLH